jgi:type IV pilus secretin PilQ/predicted competence protein
MKKTTAISSFLLITFVLLSSLLLNARATISKIEYFPGEDFVQLHMQTDKILPIPDIFYPQKDNLTRLVMRIKDVDFKVDNHSLTFDSPVIQDLNIKTSGDFSDVEIKLKGEVNYRVFTNQTGLYIEFPMIKELASRSDKKVPAKAEPLNEKTPVNPLPRKPLSQPVLAGSRPVCIQDVKVAGREQDRVSFDFVLSAKTDYRVIPIEQQPVRLAIDLQNAQSKQISKTVNIKNVKAIRGSNNSPAVYRIVFDLDYLKHFSVQAKDNLLQVEFFDEPAADAKVPALTQDKKLAIEVNAAAATMPKTPAVALDNTPQTLPVQAIPVVDKPVSAPREFFTAEKSKADTDPIKTDPVKKDNNVTAQAAPEQENTSYLKKTVEGGKSQYSGDPYDFSFKNADISNLLKFIAKISGLNMVIDPDVTGRFTCELIQVPWDQALELILKVNGLDMIQEGNILRIGKVEKLALEARQRQSLREARDQEGNLAVSTVVLSYARASALMPILKKQMSPRGELLVDERTNTLIISEVPEKIKIINNLIDTLDAANPQVSIEARIVEASTDALDTFGIQWGTSLVADPTHGNQTSLRFPSTITGSGVTSTANPEGYIINVPASSSTISPKIHLGNITNTFGLDVALSALTSRGKARLISSPRATTQNNLQAEITQGEKIPIQTNQNNTITTTYINAALELRVTPQITARGAVIMQIDLKNDVANFDRQVGNIPTIVTETAKTTVMVNDGGTIVIGGLYKISQSTSSDGVPLLSKIPLLGSLFKNSNTKNSQKELLIFITPRIIKL